MARPEVAPHVTKNGSVSVHEHPAFAQIGHNHVTGTRALYGSDFHHNGFITIRIVRSRLQRDLSRDWHFGGREIIEVNLSEAQWATFISSPGRGDGVPCTISSLQGEIVPGFPLRDEGQEFKPEVDDKLQECLAGLDQLRKTIESATPGLSKKARDTLIGAVERVRMNLGDNLPFIANSLAEHMEARVEKAKVEVHAYMQHAVVAAGLAALGVGVPLALERPSDEAEDDHA